MATFVHEFREMNDGQWYDNGWWELKGDRLVNCNGGWHDYKLSPYEERKESTWEEIKKEYYLSHIHDYQTGWLSPDGQFYGCDYRDHNNFALYIFDCYEDELENRGYCKIYRSPLEYGKIDFDMMPGGKELTKIQWKYLLDNEYTDIETYDLWVK